MSKDFDDDVLQSSLKDLQAQRMRAQAEYAEAESYGNTEAAIRASREMVACDREAQDIINLHQGQHGQRPAPLPQTPEEWRVKPASKMTADDGLLVARGSKYGKDLDWTDPNVRRGWDEMQRRRSRGE